MRNFVRPSVFVSLLAISSSASAHIDMVSPVARELDQKQGPCGVTGSVRGANVTTVRAGSTLRVTWRETVDHPSHFRISFDADGDDDFGDPAGYDDLYSNAAVLVDGISDQAGGLFSADVVLPDIECDHCTLQLVQVMYDKKPYAVGTNDLYYRCADLKLTKDPSEPSTPSTPPQTPAEALDAGAADETEPDNETDTNPAPAAGGNTDPDQQPAPSSQPSSASNEAGASGATCDALSSRAHPLHRTWPMGLFFSALLVAQRARRRARLMLASGSEPQASRENG